MTHSALLIAGGALLTCALGALLFGGKALQQPHGVDW